MSRRADATRGAGWDVQDGCLGRARRGSCIFARAWLLLPPRPQWAGWQQSPEKATSHSVRATDRTGSISCNSLPRPICAFPLPQDRRSTDRGGHAMPGRMHPTDCHGIFCSQANACLVCLIAKTSGNSPWAAQASSRYRGFTRAFPHMLREFLQIVLRQSIAEAFQRGNTSSLRTEPACQLPPGTELSSGRGRDGRWRT